MNFRLDPPAELRGTADEKLRQIYTYLFCLSENLNVSLKAMNVPEDQGNSQRGAAGENALYAQIKNTEEALEAHKKAPVYPVSVE